MATYTPGPLGPLKGKMGTLVASRWRDIYYLKARSGRSTKEPTEKKKKAQQAFGFISSWLSPMRQVVLKQFKDYHPGWDGRMSALSYNSRHALIKTADGFDIDYRAARFCYGDLPGALETAVSLKDENILVITWSREVGDGADDSDAVISILCFPAWEHQLLPHFYGSRKDGQLEVKFPSILKSGLLHVQIAFKSLINERVSISQYAGFIDFGEPGEAASVTGEHQAVSCCQPSSITGGLIKPQGVHEGREL